MDLPRYQYEPLTRPDEIRVLKLSATKRRIEIHLLHVPVSSYKFEALSYVWGKPDQADKAIILDRFGQEIGWIPLTMNLANAMCDLRGAEELTRKVLWVDQICINQQDEKEKNHQVGMMRQIYTRSRRVITYLGPSGSKMDEERGISLLKRVHESFERLPPDLDTQLDESFDENEILTRYVGQGWAWLVRVTYSEWTQRLWIVQEQLLNKKIITLRGLQLIDWDAIITAPILFAVGHLPQQYRTLGRRDMDDTRLPWDKVEETLYGIWWDRHARLEHRDRYTWSSLFHNLQWYQPLLCADPRDRVYGILAISRDAKTLGLQPDYSSANTADVLSTELSIRVLESSVDLELLSFAISWHRPNSTLPSWCLTLDSPANTSIPETLPLRVYTPHPRLYIHKPAQFRNCNSLLTVKGRVLDYVSISGSTIPWAHDDPRITSQLEFLSDLACLVSDGVSIEEIASLLRTITVKAPWSPPPDTQAGANGAISFHFWAYLQHKLRLLTESAEDLPAASKEKNQLCDHIRTKVRLLAPYIANPELLQTDNASRVESIAAESVLRYALEHGRRLGRTRGGRFFNAMYPVQEIDAIVALQGADRLFVVRPVGNAYKLIGDIFVDGLMHGEVYKDVSPDNVDYGIDLG
ncbi:heterokaryon incompatibility protein-domain-containing protein [Aspergillus floccosus]